ncbi:hypothetical protein H072_7365 [Dactylellina haptotyla CBS 200.50]|uniref:NACHT domain-containing protein n=1 Tax=Dactylellina haptotyla (strain CBS 200.50) TaxID=1284197 RepID=S8A7B4_DACHA|nr:hypothetical protein H072_7365 [Dactylellina haptotyla CBS 200.50]
MAVVFQPQNDVLTIDSGKRHYRFTFRDPWQVAKERFTEGLTDAEKASFANVKVEDVLYAASAAQKRAQGDSKAWYMASKLMPIVDAIGQYGTALDVISNAQSGILCPLWGGLRVVLTLAESFGKYHEKLMDMFERIGDVLPRFSSYAKLFPNEAYLLHALSLVYIDILEFCTAAKQVFLKGRDAKNKSGVFSPSAKLAIKLIWKLFEKQFGDVMDRFRRHKANVEKEAGLSHMIEASRERQAQEDERRLQQSERSIMLRQRIEEESRRKTGSGKTILSGWVYENQLNIVKNLDQAIALSYLCDFKEEGSLSPATILQSFIKQMLLVSGQTGTPESILEDLEYVVQSSRSLEFEDAMELFFKFARLYKHIRIVLDGIDECDNHSKGELWRWIDRASTSPDSPIAIYISSRNDIEIRDSLQHYPTISLANSQPATELTGYIVEQVSLLKAKGSLKFHNEKLYDKVVEKLTIKSDGMFLWVSLQLKDLCDCATDGEVEETLDQLPIGLYETYERGLKRIFVGSDNPRARVTCERVYNWVYHAKRPLTIDELIEAIAVDTDDRQFDPSKIATEDDRWKIIKRCGNLLEYKESDSTVTFFHYTLKQYITEVAKFKGNISSNERVVKVAKSIAAAEILIAYICVAYLSFSDFETAVIPFQEVTVKNVNTNMGGFFDDGTSTPLARQEVNFARYIYRPKPPPESVLHQYKLLRYVRNFWLQHFRTLDFEKVRRGLHKYQNLLKLLFEKELLFDIRPWGKRYSQTLYPYTDSFVWAVENDHPLLITCIYDKLDLDSEARVYYRNLKISDGTTLACIAATYQTDKCLSLLHTAQVPGTYYSLRPELSDNYLRQRDSYGRTLVHIACYNANFAVFWYILSKESTILQGLLPRDKYGNTTFDCAVESGNVNILNHFLDPATSCTLIDHRKGWHHGWSVDENSTHKLEKLFTLICTYGRFDWFTRVYSILFKEWIHGTALDNDAFLKGLKIAIEDRHILLLHKIFEDIPKLPQWNPEIQIITVQVLQLSIEFEHLPLALKIMEIFDQVVSFKDSFRKACMKRPINHKDLSFIVRLGPYPMAIPRLLAEFYQIPGFRDIDFVPPSCSAIDKEYVSAICTAFLGCEPDAFKNVLTEFTSRAETLMKSSVISVAADIPIESCQLFWQNFSICLLVYTHISHSQWPVPSGSVPEREFLHTYKPKKLQNLLEVAEVMISESQLSPSLGLVSHLDKMPRYLQVRTQLHEVQNNQTPSQPKTPLDTQWLFRDVLRAISNFEEKVLETGVNWGRSSFDPVDIHIFSLLTSFFEFLCLPLTPEELGRMLVSHPISSTMLKETCIEDLLHIATRVILATIKPPGLKGSSPEIVPDSDFFRLGVINLIDCTISRIIKLATIDTSAWPAGALIPKLRRFIDTLSLWTPNILDAMFEKGLFEVETLSLEKLPYSDALLPALHNLCYTLVVPDLPEELGFQGLRCLEMLLAAGANPYNYEGISGQIPITAYQIIKDSAPPGERKLGILGILENYNTLAVELLVTTSNSDWRERMEQFEVIKKNFFNDETSSFSSNSSQESDGRVSPPLRNNLRKATHHLPLPDFPS